MITALVISLYVLILLMNALLWGCLLRFGLYWAKAEAVSIKRVVLATALIFTIQFISIVLLVLLASPLHIPVVFELAQLLAAVLIPAIVIKQVFKTRFWRSLQAWLPTLLHVIVFLPFMHFVFKPHVLEAFKTPTNSMAPTVLGTHWQGTCVDCGSPAFCTPTQEHVGSQPMICENNFHVTHPTDYEDRIYDGDRLIAAAFLNPRRWDLIVFKYPQDPSIFYVKRLVGLPGEEITIRDGKVWADGHELEMPESIRGLRYLSEFEELGDDIWGSPQRPAKLAEDEYFVLGDFSQVANDSRLWIEGAPGHNSFAVPVSYFRGVVTHIYWPPTRWRAFQ